MGIFFICLIFSLYFVFVLYAMSLLLEHLENIERRLIEYERMDAGEHREEED